MARFSERNVCNAVSSPGDRGYTLQSNVDGASGFRSMAWSHSRESGKRWAAVSLKTCACWWYWGGTIWSHVRTVLSVACSANCCATVVLASHSVLMIRMYSSSPSSKNDGRDAVVLIPATFRGGIGFPDAAPLVRIFTGVGSVPLAQLG